MVMPKKNIGEFLRVNVIISLWPVLVITVLVFLISYLYASAYRDEIKFVVILFGGAAAIYSAYYVGAALHMQVSRDRQKASFDILDLLNRPEFIDVRIFLEKECEGNTKLSVEELFKKIEQQKELTNAVHIVMGILEDMSIAIQYEYVDEDILYLSLEALVRRNWFGLRGWVEQLRAEKNDSKLWIEIQKLADSWASGIRLSDGRKITGDK